MYAFVSSGELFESRPPPLSDPIFDDGLGDIFRWKLSNDLGLSDPDRLLAIGV